VELGLVKPGLRGVELAGTASVHLDPDLVPLLRDVAHAVKLVRSNLVSLAELSVRECALDICLLKPCLAHICETFVVCVFRRQRQVDVRVVIFSHRHLGGRMSRPPNRDKKTTPSYGGCLCCD